MGTDAAANGRTPPTCAACGRIGRPGEQFCERCNAPLTVARLDELNDDDRRAALSKGLEVLAASTRLAPVPAAVDDDLWHAYLSAFWLRPETALVLYGEAVAIRELSADATGPWLDLGCGDGVHAALYSGWRFDPAFDVFQSVDLTAADVYHHFDPAAFAARVAEPGRVVEFGVDIKETAIARASALPGVFGSVRKADAAGGLPVDDASVGVVFSNMLRHLDETLDAGLAEVARVLRPGDGRLLLSTITPDYERALIFANAADQADDAAQAEQMRRLDRGRSVFCKHRHDADGWDAILRRHGLRVAGKRTIAGAEVTALWDVGLRPFTTPLLSWRGSAGGDLLPVKRATMAVLDALLRPALTRRDEGPACFQLLDVRRAS